MISRTHDFDTPERLIHEQIKAELDLRTPEEIAAAQAEGEERLQRVFTSLEIFWKDKKKMGNKKKLDAFLSAATNLRKFCSAHSGWIKYSVSDEWHGSIEMRFETLFFMETDSSDSHKIFASIFESFRNVTISVHEEKVRVQIFEELFDIIPVDVSDEKQEPR